MNANYIASQAKWVLLHEIYESVLKKILAHNEHVPNSEKLTLTAKHHVGEGFEVYSQPVGAYTAIRSDVKWLTYNHISIERYPSDASQMKPDQIELLEVETTPDGMQKTLRNKSIDQVSTEIVEQAR